MSIGSKPDGDIILIREHLTKKKISLVIKPIFYLFLDKIGVTLVPDI